MLRSIGKALVNPILKSIVGKQNKTALHADTIAWKNRVAANGGVLSSAEIAAHDTWRKLIGDTIASKIRACHFYWLASDLAARTPYFNVWGPSLLTIEGSPSKVARGYAFTGIAGQRIRTGITPSSQSGFSQLDQFFMVFPYGRNNTLADQALCGSRSNSGTYRTGANWRTTNSMEVYGGLSSEANNNYTQTDGPFSGTIGLRVLSGTAVSYRNDVAKTTTAAYVTDAKPSAEEWVGGLNGIGTTYYNGDMGCWMRGMGLTDAEYILLSSLTRALADTLEFFNALVARGDSLVASGSGMTLASGAIDPTLWFQFSTTNRAVGGTNIDQIRAAQDAEFLSTPNEKTFIGVYSAGRNDFRFNSDVQDMYNRIISLLVNGNPSGHYRWFEIPPQSMGNNDEDAGSTFFNRRVQLNNAVEATIGQRCVRVVEAMRASATLSNATDIADLDRGLTPTSLRSDTLHPNAAGQTVMKKCLWETLKNGLGLPKNVPTNFIVPILWVGGKTGATGSIGDTLKIANGGWSGNPIFTYTWFYNGEEIPGQTNSTLVVSATGNYECDVTATNEYGTNTVKTAQVFII